MHYTHPPTCPECGADMRKVAELDGVLIRKLEWKCPNCDEGGE